MENNTQTTQPLSNSIEPQIDQHSSQLSSKNYLKIFLIGFIVLGILIGGLYILIILSKKETNTIKNTENSISIDNSQQIIPSSTPSANINQTITTQQVYKVAFTKAGDIWVVNSDGTGLKQLTSYGLNFEPKLSPDGEFVAYYSIDQKLKSTLKSDTGANYTGITIWVIKTDGTGATKITESNVKAHRTSLSWSPMSDKLLYIEDGKIIVVNPGGSNKRVITDLSQIPHAITIDSLNHQLVFTQWSPNGNEIAVQIYTRAPEGKGDRGEYQLVLMDLNGKIIKQYPNVNLGRWSKINNKLYYTEGTNGIGTYGFWSQNIDGSEKKLVAGTDDPFSKNNVRENEFSNTAIYGAGQVAFSSTSTQIASSKRLREIWTMSIDGAESRKIYEFADNQNISIPSPALQWLPDNQDLIFQTINNKSNQSTLYSIKSDGTNLKAIDTYQSSKTKIPYIIRDYTFSTGTD